MRVLKYCLPVIMAVLLLVAWLICIAGVVGEMSAYQECIDRAEKSMEAKLYEQAVECYHDSLRYRESADTYDRIQEAMEMLYSEEHTAYVRELYISNLQEATTAYPKRADYWVKIIQLYQEAENDSMAYETVQKAQNRGASSDELDALYQELLYQVKTDYKLYQDFKTALNGYILVFDGAQWQALDGTGEELTDGYDMIGLINDNGEGIYVNDLGARLLDQDQIARARFDLDIQDAGCYDAESGYTPVLIDDVWRYMDLEGEFLPGEYDAAGGFNQNIAAAKQEDGQWIFLDQEGQEAFSGEFEDVKLDLYGHCLQGDVILAKEGEEYHIYDDELEQVGDFSCDNIDASVDEGPIAYEEDGKWGFVDHEGNVVLEPEYAGAKSYTNGMAAVCNSEGLWGYLNKDYELVVDYQFQDAFYFNSDEVSVVQTDDSCYQLLKFQF